MTGLTARLQIPRAVQNFQKSDNTASQKAGLTAHLQWPLQNFQKSDTRPLKLQSPSIQRFTGSRFGPPFSPVTGFVSPSNSC